MNEIQNYLILNIIKKKCLDNRLKRLFNNVQIKFAIMII